MGLRARIRLEESERQLEWILDLDTATKNERAHTCDAQPLRLRWLKRFLREIGGSTTRSVSIIQPGRGRRSPPSVQDVLSFWVVVGSRRSSYGDGGGMNGGSTRVPPRSGRPSFTPRVQDVLSFFLSFWVVCRCRRPSYGEAAGVTDGRLVDHPRAFRSARRRSRAKRASAVTRLER